MGDGPRDFQQWRLRPAAGVWKAAASTRLWMRHLRDPVTRRPDVDLNVWARFKGERKEDWDSSEEPRRRELSPPAPDWLLAGCLADAPTRKLVGGHLLPW